MNTNESTSLRPKRRFKRDVSTDLHLGNQPRMKRSGRLHQQWINPSPIYSEPVEKLPIGPALHELLTVFGRSYLRLAHSPRSH